jgi:hypothetical protein
MDVAATDGMVVVGAYLDVDDKGTDWCIRKDEKTSAGQYEQASKLVTSDGAMDIMAAGGALNDHFGCIGSSIAATDHDGMHRGVVRARLVVGAYGEDDDNGGSAYVFK